MTQHPGLMSDQFSDALYAEIDGHTPREILIESYELQIDAAKTDLKNYEPMLEKFRRMRDDRSLTDDQQHEARTGLAQIESKVSDRNEKLKKLQLRLEKLKSENPSGA
jgi:outer membrane protein TolC